MSLSVARRPTILVNHLMEPPGRITGITRFLFALLTELGKLNHFNYVLATAWTEDQLPRAMMTHALQVKSCEYYESTPLNILNQMRLIPHLMKEFGAVAEFNCNPLGCFSSNWPRIITVHDLYFDVLPQQYNWRHKLWWKVFFHLAMHGTTKAICVSQSTKRDLQFHWPRFADKAVVVHEASALPSPQNTMQDFPEHLKGREFALFVGNISPNKNVSCLVNAIRLLELQGRSLRLVHVGRDDAGLLSAAIEATCLESPLTSFAGVTDRELIAIYQSAMMLIAPSTYEGFCLPVLEAQSCGTPVICSDISVLREVTGNAAVFFDPSRADSLATCIDQVRNDQNLRRNLSLQGLANSAKFSWTFAAEQIEDTLLNIAEEKPLRRYF